MRAIQVVSPLDGRQLGEFTVADPAQISRQITAARAAADAWQAVSIKQRLKILGPLKGLLLGDLDGICEQIRLCTGKARTEALLGEIYPVLDLLSYYEKQAPRILRRQIVSTSSYAFPGATASIERRPYGVVAVISPWNYPFQLTVAPILTALLAGNAVIFKPSELCLPVGQMIFDLFARLDLPDHLLQWLPGEGDTGQQLIDAGPDLLLFTGGLNTGRAVMQRAARHPMPVILELGGKDPMLVFADAVLPRAAEAALYGAFCNSGQACVSIERLYVQQACFQTFLAMLIDGLAKLKVSADDANGDIGAMTSARQIDIIKAHYEDAIAQGAVASGPLQQEGNVIRPVLLWNVHHGMRVMREESFGPLLPIMSFADEAEALRWANDSEFGLNASIWSRDIARAERIARQLAVGNWVINDVLKNVGHAGLPFGGIKKSGFGRYHGADGLRSFTYTVSGLTNRNRLLKEPNWFPYSELHYQHLKGFMDFLHGSGTISQRTKRNWPALMAFRDYSAINLKQSWHNLLSRLPWNRDN